MEQFTAEEYRVAAKVLRASKIRGLSEEYDRRAAKVGAQEEYATALGLFVEDLDRSDSSLYNGSSVLKRLITDGWTPPEGLV